MLYTTKDWNDFSTCFVRKTFNGYKYIYGGTGDVSVSADGKELTRIKDNISPRYTE